MKHIALFCFANNRDDYLEHLTREREQIQYVLKDAKNVEMVSVVDANRDSLTRAIRDHKDSLFSFHFAGHSGSASLGLLDIDARGDSIAAMLGSVHCVFLNGCANRGLVKFFHDRGVKVVIATSVAIDDGSATEFAIQFYGAFANGSSIKDAFESAAAYIMAPLDSEERFPQNFFQELDEDGQSNDVLPWAIYALHGKREEANLKMPKNQVYQLVTDYEMNRAIVERLAELFIEHNSDSDEMAEIKALLEKHKQQKELAFNKLSVAVIDMLPFPLGEPLRKMKAVQNSTDLENIRYKDLLQHQVNLYDALIRYCTYTLLSCLFEIFSDPATRPQLTPEQWECLTRFFKDRSEQSDEFDYVNAIIRIIQILKSSKTEKFIRRFAGNEPNGDALNQSLFFVRGLKRTLREGVDSQSYAELCRLTESHLCEAFQHVFIILTCKLVVIKEISLEKFRNSTVVTYYHNRMVLHYTNTGVDDTQWKDLNYTDDHSVILINDLKQGQPYLSLSPFVIDTNAIVGVKNPRLYYFNHLKEEGVYTYRLFDDLKTPFDLDSKAVHNAMASRAIKPSEIQRIEKRFEELRRQLKEFKDILQKLKP